MASCFIKGLASSCHSGVMECLGEFVSEGVLDVDVESTGFKSLPHLFTKQFSDVCSVFPKSIKLQKKDGFCSVAKFDELLDFRWRRHG